MARMPKVAAPKRMMSITRRRKEHRPAITATITATAEAIVLRTAAIAITAAIVRRTALTEIAPHPAHLEVVSSGVVRHPAIRQGAASTRAVHPRVAPQVAAVARQVAAGKAGEIDCSKDYKNWNRF